MKQWSTSTLQRFNSRNCCMLVLSSLTVICAAEIVNAQRRGPASGAPSPAIRERNRTMDEYDRALNRMRNDAKAKALNSRRRSLFPQIDEDFQRIQVIHNEIVRMYQPEKTLDYNRLAELTDDLRKRTARLRENLALPEPEKSETKATHVETIDESHLRKDIVALHDLVVSFVANPIFKNLGVVDATMIDSASQNLNNLIGISDEIKREAKMLGRTAKK